MARVETGPIRIGDDWAEAAAAIAAVARDILAGRYSAQARVTDNPMVFVTEVNDAPDQKGGDAPAREDR